MPDLTATEEDHEGPLAYANHNWSNDRPVEDFIALINERLRSMQNTPAPPPLH